MPHFFVVDALVRHPFYECPLCWVAHADVCCGVQCDGPGQCHVAVLVEGQHLFHVHAVLRQCSCLVGADDVHRPHCLACVQFPHEVIALQHAPHVQCQCQCHRHRQTLGHRHHDESHRHHEVFQHHLYHADVVVGMPEVVVGDNVVQHEEHECRHGNGDSRLADEFCQSFQLHVQRCLHSCLLVTAACHMPYLGAVAHRRHNIFAHAVHHHRGAQHHVLGVCLVAFAPFVVVGMLCGELFSCQRRLVYLQV